LKARIEKIQGNLSDVKGEPHLPLEKGVERGESFKKKAELQKLKDRWRF
jgi:hypothetical protein